ncbi:hypothetical protein TYRP_010575 [Tyrophagus putrescentiae]|nr:hypothetical protein TYRP_010575 [Tyrophagus putrescentiae]
MVDGKSLIAPTVEVEVEWLVQERQPEQPIKSTLHYHQCTAVALRGGLQRVRWKARRGNLNELIKQY